MINPTTFYEIISKKRKGSLALLARSAFRLIEFPYTWAVQSRNRAFTTGKKEIYSVSVPVLSVGNLTVGGTGKTPFIQWLARFYRNHQTRVSIISRGYNSDKATGTNDEGLLLHRTLPDVPHIQNPDRVSSANIAITELWPQSIHETNLPVVSWKELACDKKPISSMIISSMGNGLMIMFMRFWTTNGVREIKRI